MEICADLSYIDSSQSHKKTNTIILPLSLENNSTLAGTCAILDQFAKEFSIPTSCQSENLPFDNNWKTFCLKQAREHAEFIFMMNHHVQAREQYELLMEGMGVMQMVSLLETYIVTLMMVVVKMMVKMMERLAVMSVARERKETDQRQL